MKIFISGLPGVGKTTLIMNLSLRLRKEKKICGFATPAIFENGKRIGFLIVDLSSWKKYTFAHISGSGKKFGKYFVNIKIFNSVLEKVEKEMENKEIIIIDEIGKMEFMSKRFNFFLKRVLGSEKDLVATLHRAFIHKFRNYGEVVWLKRNESKKVLESIIQRIL